MPILLQMVTASSLVIRLRDQGVKPRESRNVRLSRSRFIIRRAQLDRLTRFHRFQDLV